MGRIDPDRLRLYRYATVPEAADYVAIMRAFSSTLMAEWSAGDLVARGVDLSVDVLEQRLRYLADHGNLLVSPREVRVASIAEYQRQPARYSMTSLGARVHRQVEELLGAAGGAREVSQELVASIAQRLSALADLVEAPGGVAGADPQALAEAVTTVFLQFADFAGSVTDFYTYVGSVLNRADFDDDEWVGFKHLLLDYLETIVENVTRHAPAVRAALSRLEPALDDILGRLDRAAPEMEALRAASPGDGIQRAQGRSRADWVELRDWFGSRGDRTAGAHQLRDAAGRAVGTLLSNLKRMNATSTREESMRRHFLRLAQWFDRVSPDEAHVLFTSAFALYGARHLGIPLDPAVAEAVPATVSWWRSPTAPVPVSLRERGDRTPRGRSVRVPDHARQKQRLLAERRRDADRRRAAAQELLAAGDRLDQVRLSGAALQLLLELLARATATLAPESRVASASSDDEPVTLWLVVDPDEPGGRTVVRSEDGELVLYGPRVVACPPGRIPGAVLDVGADVGVAGGAS